MNESANFHFLQRLSVIFCFRRDCPRSLASCRDCCAQGSLVRYPVWQHTFVSPSAFSRRAVVSYWRKYVHEVLVNRLGGLSLPRKSVVRLTDRPDMTLDVYRGRKTTIQQQRLLCSVHSFLQRLCDFPSCDEAESHMGSLGKKHEITDSLGRSQI